ncbi:hypothetical protein Acsp05_52190 [Actinokineospora sp. NBRC 105648]|nr:hypothetical protein Acsp05_52190 [Actinokineospora sp. NBRC 105648]
MKIGIIGAGNIGGALTRLFTKAGHQVAVANSRGPHTLADLAAETGATAVEAADAAQGADLVIVTIPQKHIPALPAGILDGAAEGATFVDTGNYYPRERDGAIDEIEAGALESEWVQRQLGKPVVKAFNNIGAASLFENGKPAGSPGRIALPISGDDAAAKAVVAGVIEEIGFDVVDVGPLSESWRQQPGTPGYGADFGAERLRVALGEAGRERTEAFRAQ